MENVIKCELCDLQMKTRVSDWTNTLHLTIDELKKQSVLTAGFNFLKLVFNRKGELLNE